MDKGKSWHIDNGILFIEKGFKPGKGFLPWFDDRDRITDLILEEGMEEIGREWCSYLGGVRTLELPHSLKAIGPGAFEDCTGIREAIIPEGVTSIGARAFMGCESLRRLSQISIVSD